MGLTVNNSVNIAPDVPQDDKPDIQRKLEEWERPELSKESLSAKLKKASERRVETISHMTKRASEHCNEVKRSVMDLNSQNSVETLELEAKLLERAAKASKHKRERMDIIAKKNKQIEEKVIQKKELDHVKSKAIEIEVDKKIKAAAQRKDQFLIKNTALLIKKAMKVEKVKKHDLDKVKELEAMVTSKLDAAADRKMKVISEMSTSVSSSAKQKEERVKLLKYSKEADILSAKKKIENKLIEASQRKKNSIFYRKVMSAEKNYAKFERVKELSKQRLFDEREVQCKHENRMMAVMQRKGRLQEKENEKNEKMNIRREIALEKHAVNENCSIQKVKNQTEVKINDAAQRRIDRQAKENERAEITNTRREIAFEKHAKNKDCIVQKAKEQTSVKISEAIARRAAHLLQKSEHASANGTRTRSNSEKGHTLETQHMKEEIAQLPEDGIYLPFHARLQIFLIAILSHIAGIIRIFFQRK